MDVKGGEGLWDGTRRAGSEDDEEMGAGLSQDQGISKQSEHSEIDAAVSRLLGAAGGRERASTGGSGPRVRMPSGSDQGPDQKTYPLPDGGIPAAARGGIAANSAGPVGADINRIVPVTVDASYSSDGEDEDLRRGELSNEPTDTLNVDASHANAGVARSQPPLLHTRSTREFRSKEQNRLLPLPPANAANAAADASFDNVHPMLKMMPSTGPSARRALLGSRRQSQLLKSAMQYMPVMLDKQSGELFAYG